MKCSKVQRLLSDWHNGELSPEVDAAIAEHVDGCGSCQQIATAYDEMMTLLGEATPAELPSDFAAAAHQRLVAESARSDPAAASRLARWLPSLMRGGAMVGAGALAVLAVWWSQGGTARPSPVSCEPVTAAADADLALGEIAMVTLSLDAAAGQEIEIEIVLPDGLALIGDDFDALPEKVVSFMATHQGEPIRLPVRAERPGTWLLIAHARTDGGDRVTSETRLHVPPA